MLLDRIQFRRNGIFVAICNIQEISSIGVIFFLLIIFVFFKSFKFRSAGALLFLFVFLYKSITPTELSSLYDI